MYCPLLLSSAYCRNFFAIVSGVTFVCWVCLNSCLTLVSTGGELLLAVFFFLQIPLPVYVVLTELGIGKSWASRAESRTQHSTTQLAGLCRAGIQLNLHWHWKFTVHWTEPNLTKLTSPASLAKKTNKCLKIIFLTLFLSLAGSQRFAGEFEIHLVSRAGNLRLGTIRTPEGAQGDVWCTNQKE